LICSTISEYGARSTVTPIPNSSSNWLVKFRSPAVAARSSAMNVISSAGLASASDLPPDEPVKPPTHPASVAVAIAVAAPVVFRNARRFDSLDKLPSVGIGHTYQIGWSTLIN
jgi:hypothetical protein